MNGVMFYESLYHIIRDMNDRSNFMTVLYLNRNIEKSVSFMLMRFLSFFFFIFVTRRIEIMGKKQKGGEERELTSVRSGYTLLRDGPATIQFDRLSARRGEERGRERL